MLSDRWPSCASPGSGHGGILYRSPGDKWVWVDRWTGAPTYADAYRSAGRSTSSPRPTAISTTSATTPRTSWSWRGRGGTVVGSHEMSLYLGVRGVEAVGMNKGGRFEAAGIGFTMVHADHTGGVTITGGDAETTATSAAGAGCIEFEDGTRVYHTGDTDLFGDMALVRDAGRPSITVLPIGGHYTMGPRRCRRAVGLIGAHTVIPVHYGTFPILAGTPDRAGGRDRRRWSRWSRVRPGRHDMSLILGILAGLLGSLFGSAAKAGAAMGRAQLAGEPMPDVMNLSGSPIAGVVGGVVGAVAGPRTAFWLGAVMGAAGVDRFDAFLLKQVGIDMDAMVAKANVAAQSAAGEYAEAAGQWVGEVADAANQATCGGRRRSGEGRRGGRLANGWPRPRPRCGSTWSAATSGPLPALSTGPAGADQARTMSRPSRPCWPTRRVTRAWSSSPG